MLFKPHVLGDNLNKMADTSFKDLQATLLEVETAKKQRKGEQVSSVPTVYSILEEGTSTRDQSAKIAVQAITNVILSQGGDTVPASYFGLILSSLSSVKDEKEADILLYLLKLILPEISPAILLSQFGTIASILLTQLQTHYNSENILVPVIFFFLDLNLKDFFLDFFGIIKFLLNYLLKLEM